MGCPNGGGVFKVCIGKEGTGVRGGVYGCLVDGERDGSVVNLTKGWVMYKVFDTVGGVGQQEIKDVGGFVVSDPSWLVDELGEEVVCKAVVGSECSLRQWSCHKAEHTNKETKKREAP
ncbi:hypothetical protein CAPTEDRAFT_216099 [Capitella teleta]|uniref:Uncharacterized protein n=1 Tax=Capitella teleta TaxID=283909 RepID=R7U1L4_CAPTE|nr:hypothetical protein CAPTEDRAFT_216099 [Capitella teleta]|eukprot:ELT97556.1 hypothetical protein CAPTEDRAFT_216099 [Capitella teleta]